MTYEEATNIIFEELVRHVDTPEEEAYRLAIEAMELQVAKKVETMEGDRGRKIPICPSCECLLVESEIAGERCCECGQLLDTEDWSEE